MNSLFKLVLKGSAISALSLVALAAGCSSDSDPATPGAGGEDSSEAGTGGKSPTAGTKGSQAGDTGVGGDPGVGGTAGAHSGGDNAGGTSVGGNGSGGDNAGGDNASAGHNGIGLGDGGSDFGGGGQPGTGTGPSVAKFCNTLSFGGDDTTFVLEVGEGSAKVTFTATTGECVPADGDACVEIPQGVDVPIALFDADDTSTPLDEGFATVDPGEDWVFWNAVPDAQPVIKGQALDKSEAVCEDVIYSDIP